MPNPRLIAVITALAFLSNTTAARAAFSIEELLEIERLVMSRDCGALRVYLSVNPSLTEGDDPLARELRNFVTEVDSGSLIQCLAAPEEQIATREGDISDSLTSIY
ncbi:MAG: hypothetical protein AAF601_17070 [Pseudomonadota bacterium]